MVDHCTISPNVWLGRFEEYVRGYGKYFQHDLAMVNSTQFGNVYLKYLSGYSQNYVSQPVD